MTRTQRYDSRNITQHRGDYHDAILMSAPFIEFRGISFSYYIVTRSAFLMILKVSTHKHLLLHALTIEHTSSPNCISISSVTVCNGLFTFGDKNLVRCRPS